MRWAGERRSQRRNTSDWNDIEIIKSSYLIVNFYPVSISPFVYFPAMAYSHHQYDEPFIFYTNDDPVITDAVSPELTEPGALKRLTEAARILKTGEPVVEKDKKLSGMLGIEPVEFLCRGPGKLNSPGHTGS